MGQQQQQAVLPASPGVAVGATASGSPVPLVNPEYTSSTYLRRLLVPVRDWEFSLSNVAMGCMILVVLLYLRQRFILAKPIKIHHAPRTISIRRRKKLTKDVRCILEELPLHTLVRRECPALADPLNKQNIYSPTFYLWNGHLQTIYAALFGDYAKPAVTFDRELLFMPDGGNIALDWNPGPPTENDPTPIVIVLHGLTGGSHERYVQDIIAEVTKMGYRSVVTNFRGCADSTVTSQQLYSGAYTGDLKFAIDYIHSKCPEAPLFGVGFSLGANVLTKFVGESGDDCLLIGAAALANPFDLLLGTHVMHRTWFGRNIYSKRMTENLRNVFKRHMHQFTNSEWLDLKGVFSAKYIYEFDDALTRRNFNFRTVHEYYRKGSSAQFVPDIRRPMLLFSAMDDPIATKASIPFFEVKENPYVLLATTAHGGHIGWFTGLIPKRMHAKPVGEFIRAIVEAHQSLPKESKQSLVSAAHLPLPPRRASLISAPSLSAPGPAGTPQGKKASPAAAASSKKTAQTPTTTSTSSAPLRARSSSNAPTTTTLDKKPTQTQFMYMARLLPKSRLIILLIGFVLGLGSRGSRKFLKGI
ncbi:Alpha/Beta hydrolase protein [Phlyctochytrium arcticum]|nr:Alpha/Beta hydrolase protein [Phlyctochytrium arcticum]